MDICAALPKAGRVALDFLYPPRCLICERDVDRAGGACPACWGKLKFLTRPFCACCGAPFSYDLGENALCAGCVASPPPFDRARAALAYDAVSRPLLVGLKHDRLHGLPTLARWMLRDGEALLADADMVCAVPLHRWRLLGRGYNQASLLAGHLARHAGVRHVPDLLVRRRATVSQGGLSRSGRQRNVRGAFVPHPRWQGLIEGARIVVVDDVFTTGATVGECCRVLQRAGATRVDVLCGARVIASG